MSDSERPVTSEKVALAPDLRQLSDRAIRAWVEQMAIQPLGEAYAVESESDTTYIVDPTERTCTCPDREIRGETCKHLRRVAIEITAGRVPPPGKRRDRCRACNAETFVPSDASGPALCEGCRVEPGDMVLDRETGDRLVVVAVTDDRADEVRVDGTTVAAYPTNDGYPADDVVVEAVYLSETMRRVDPTQYSFPLSRLEPTDGAALVE